MKNAKYIEPTDFIPEEIRRKVGLGEFNTDFDEPKKKVVKKTAKKPAKKSKVEEVKEAMKSVK